MFLPTLSDHGLWSPDAGSWFLLGALLDSVPPPEVEHGHDLVSEALLVLLVSDLRPRSLVPLPESEAIISSDANPQPRHPTPPCPPIVSWNWDRLMKIESHIKTSLVNRTVNMKRVISPFFNQWEKRDALFRRSPYDEMVIDVSRIGQLCIIYSWHWKPSVHSVRLFKSQIFHLKSWSLSCSVGFKSCDFINRQSL